MSPRRTVLFLGSSAIDFTDTTPQESLLSLTLDELRRRAPDVDWRAEKEALFFAPNMPQRAAAARDRVKPDAVFLCPPNYTFLHETVINRLPRWRWLHRLSVLSLRTFVNLAGGGFEGSPSRRGLIFRVPRALLHRVLPPKPLLPQDDALSLTLATLDCLVEGDAPAVVCRLAIPTAPTLDATARRYRAVLDRYNEALIRHCDEHAIVTYDLISHLVQAGEQLHVHADFLHLALPSRRFESRVLADKLLQALNLASQPRNSVGE